MEFACGRERIVLVQRISEGPAFRFHHRLHIPHCPFPSRGLRGKIEKTMDRVQGVGCGFGIAVPHLVHLPDALRHERENGSGLLGKHRQEGFRIRGACEMVRDSGIDPAVLPDDPRRFQHGGIFGNVDLSHDLRIQHDTLRRIARKVHIQVEKIRMDRWFDIRGHTLLRMDAGVDTPGYLFNFWTRRSYGSRAGLHPPHKGE